MVYFCIQDKLVVLLYKGVILWLYQKREERYEEYVTVLLI